LWTKRRWELLFTFNVLSPPQPTKMSCGLRGKDLFFSCALPPQVFYPPFLHLYYSKFLNSCQYPFFFPAHKLIYELEKKKGGKGVSSRGKLGGFQLFFREALCRSLPSRLGIQSGVSILIFLSFSHHLQL
jgi:hypothetical protein